MERIKLLAHDAVPCWYELSFKGTNGRSGILLRIHSDFAKNMGRISKVAPTVTDFMGRFKFQNFSGRFGKDFGFEDALKYLGVKGEFLEYEIPTPPVKKFRGKGRVSYYDFRDAYAASASLSVLFCFLRFPDEDTSAKQLQLMSVYTITEQLFHGASLGGSYSSGLVDYLRKRPVGRIPEMVAAMRTVHERMEGEIKSFYEHSFEAHTQGSDGWLNVMCPGDAAGLHPANFIDEERGYEFSSHNVDQPVQQLTLLASLAVLHDLVRAANP